MSNLQVGLAIKNSRSYKISNTSDFYASMQHGKLSYFDFTLTTKKVVLHVQKHTRIHENPRRWEFDQLYTVMHRAVFAADGSRILGGKISIFD